MLRFYIILASISGALAVALGAFGAHGLKKIVAPETVSSFQTGVQYQVYHSLALLAAAMVFEKFPQRQIRWACACFVAGIILFSGSLYLLTALKATDTVGLNGIGIITPFGGLLFILGWLFLAWGTLSRRS